MTSIALRGGIEIVSPLQVAVAFLDAYPERETHDFSGPGGFDERDLRLANRAGARISAAEIAAVLERRNEIEHALGEIPPGKSLASSAVPWGALTRLFDAFADIRGVGYSKMTKALHRKRPALIPMLDSVVQEYLSADELERHSTDSFAQRAVTLVREYKQDLDHNQTGLRELRRELERCSYRVTEVRLLDLLIWSALAAR